MRVVEFEKKYQEQVVNLIVQIQREEFGVDITAEQQPDLSQIPEYYQLRKGNFWVAIDEDLVVGTISLLDIGNDEAALRKMFVARSYRGAGYGTARTLLATLLTWAKSKGIKTIYLGTTEKFLAAHRFYEKNGFSLIGKDQLPDSFPLMAFDSRFYALSVS